MKNVLFILKYPLDEDYSIKNKADGQMSAVQELGNNSLFLGYDHKYFYLFKNGNKRIIKKIKFRNMPGYSHTKVFYDLFDCVKRVLELENIDVVYKRLCPLSYTGYKMIKAIKKHNAKLIVEIPTYPVESEKPRNFFRRIYTYYSEFWRKKSVKHVDLYTVIGKEAHYYNGKPAINIVNGVDVKNTPLKTFQFSEDGKIHILGLASMCDWQGFDRVISGINQLTNEEKKDFILDLVGSDGDGSLRKWKKMVDDNNLNEYVKFHGFKSGKELDDIFKTATIGLAPLANHRKLADIVSYSLKVREYMCRGLPFIYAWDDPSIKGNESYVMRVNSDETFIDMHQVKKFVERIKENPKHIAEMRANAIENMSWNKEYIKIFNKISEIEE